MRDHGDALKARAGIDNRFGEMRVWCRTLGWLLILADVVVVSEEHAES